MATLDDISRELECSICGSVMIDPRVLPCQHSFCLRCIFVLIKRDHSQNPSIKCPFGCPVVCSSEHGDVRSLKRNPLIASLCSSRRKSLFRPEDASCDWCSSDHVQCKMCSRCSSTICHRCDDEAMSDHAFLCSDYHNSRTSPTSAAAPGDDRGHSNQSESIKRYASFVTSASAVASITDFFKTSPQLRQYTPKDGGALVIEGCEELLYIPHYVQNCLAKVVTSQGGEQASSYSVLIPAVDDNTPATFALLPKVPESQRLWDAEELTILSRCIAGTEVASSIVDACVRVANQVKRALTLPSTTHTDINISLSVSVFLRETFDLISFVVIPLFRRSALFANFWGHKHVDRLCQLFAQIQTVAGKAEATKRIRAYLEIGGGLGKQFQSAADETLRKLDTLATAVRGLDEKLEFAFTELHSSTKRCPSDTSSSETARPRLSNLLNLPEHLESVRMSFTTIVETLRTNLSQLHHVMPEALRGIGLSDDARATIISLEKKFVEECDKFLGICGSSQHIHVLWTQCTIVLGKRFERTNLQQFILRRRGRFALGEPFSLLKLNENIEQASRMMATVTPQIGSVREQHVALLRRNITDMNGLLVLQGQLCNLTTQVLDVFQKEHFIKLREVSTSATEYLIDLSNFVTHAYLSAQPEDRELLAPSDDVTEISRTLTNLGSLLNEKCKVVHRSSATLLELTRCMGRCAAVLLHANTVDLLSSAPGAPALASSGDLDGENASLFGNVEFNDDSSVLAVNEVRRRVAKDIPNMIKGAVTVQFERRSRILLPFRRGRFFIPDKFPFRAFEYLVDAQTGDFILEDVPEYGFDRVLTFIEKLVNSKSTFVLMNSALAIAAIAYKKMH